MWSTLDTYYAWNDGAAVHSHENDRNRERESQERLEIFAVGLRGYSRTSYEICICRSTMDRKPGQQEVDLPMNFENSGSHGTAEKNTENFSEFCRALAILAASVTATVERAWGRVLRRRLLKQKSFPDRTLGSIDCIVLQLRNFGSSVESN